MRSGKYSGGLGLGSVGNPFSIVVQSEAYSKSTHISTAKFSNATHIIKHATTIKEEDKDKGERRKSK